MRRSVWYRLAVVLCVLTVPLAAGAQAPRGEEPTLADIALRWAEGEFGSPLICQIGGEPVRGLRRLTIAPPRRREHPPVARITFVDLEAEEASRCFTELEADVPNVTGWVQIRLPGNHRADTAERDFREAMRRKRGFEFQITAGSLSIQPVTQPPTQPRAVAFTGGTAKLADIRPGTDSARLLAGFRTPRKLLLELEAKDGTQLALPLYVPEPK